jgi:hypothetical protein
VDADLVRLARGLAGGDEGGWLEAVETSLPAAARRWECVPLATRPGRRYFAALEGLALGRYVLALETGIRPARIEDAQLARFLALWDRGSIGPQPTLHSDAWVRRERAAQLETFRARLTAAGHDVTPASMGKLADPVAATWRRLTDPEAVADPGADPDRADLGLALADAFTTLGARGPGWPPPVADEIAHEVRARYERFLRAEKSAGHA